MIRNLCYKSLAVQNIRSDSMICACNVQKIIPARRLSQKQTLEGFDLKKYNRRVAGKKKVDGVALSLLIIPISSFGLGVWQIFRKQVKEKQIAQLESRTNQEPVPLSDKLSDLELLEYCPVTVKGRFLYDKEFYIGPKNLLKSKGKHNLPGNPLEREPSGYLVVTPLQLSDSGKSILVNRGWVPAPKVKDGSYKVANFNKEFEFTGLVRKTIDNPPFGVKNTPGSKYWLYRDIPEMAKVANTEEIFIDADTSITVPGGPIGGQTNIVLRNEHLSYIFTWFGLSLGTALMWYMKYIRNF